MYSFELSLGAILRSVIVVLGLCRRSSANVNISVLGPQPYAKGGGAFAILLQLVWPIDVVNDWCYSCWCCFLWSVIIRVGRAPGAFPRTTRSPPNLSSIPKITLVNGVVGRLLATIDSASPDSAPGFCQADRWRAEDSRGQLRTLRSSMHILRENAPLWQNRRLRATQGAKRTGKLPIHGTCQEHFPGGRALTKAAVHAPLQPCRREIRALHQPSVASPTPPVQIRFARGLGRLQRFHGMPTEVTLKRRKLTFWPGGINRWPPGKTRVTRSWRRV